jgi:hypothetical protein
VLVVGYLNERRLRVGHLDVADGIARRGAARWGGAVGEMARRTSARYATSYCDLSCRSRPTGSRCRRGS